MPTTLTLYTGNLASDTIIERCTLASLEARVRAINPYHIGRVLRHLGVSVFRPAPLSQHAIVPFGFRRRVGWVTQKSVLRTSPLSERDRTAGEMAHVIGIADIEEPTKTRVVWVNGREGTSSLDKFGCSGRFSALSHSR